MAQLVGHGPGTKIGILAFSVAQRVIQWSFLLS